MAIQYVKHASGNAMWCGTMFALRSALEVLVALLLAPWTLLLATLRRGSRSGGGTVEVHHVDTPFNRCGPSQTVSAPLYSPWLSKRAPESWGALTVGHRTACKGKGIQSIHASFCLS